MKRKVLALYYSQSGQLEAIARSFTQPLAECEAIEFRLVPLEPAVPYPFPWPFYRFFDVLPESVLMQPPAMKPFPFDETEEADLVLLFYQVWFLSPSLPVTGFLCSKEAAVLADTPVITVVNARDKWVMAQEQVAQWVRRRGGRLVDHVAVVSPGSAFGNLVSTLRWLWTGKKKGFWRFPDAGVPEERIQSLKRYGELVRDGLLEGRIASGCSVLSHLNPAVRDPHLLRQEKAAYGMFRRWARWIRCLGPQGRLRRAPLIVLFVAQLAVLIGLSFPIGVFLKVFVDPFRKGAMRPR